MGVIRWIDRELRLMCRQGLLGLIAVGIIVTVALNIPLVLAQIFVPGFHYYKFLP